MTIKHQHEIKSSVSEVYEVLSTLGGLRSWWTTDVQGDPAKGGELRLSFGPEHVGVMHVADSRKNKWVIWTITSCTLPSNETWNETQISLRLLESPSRGTIAIFEHAGGAAYEALCKGAWSDSIESLLLLCETGKGSPRTPKRVHGKGTGWSPVS